MSQSEWNSLDAVAPFLWNLAIVAQPVRRSHRWLVVPLAQMLLVSKDNNNLCRLDDNAKPCNDMMQRADITRVRRSAFFLSGFRLQSRMGIPLARCFGMIPPPATSADL